MNWTVDFLGQAAEKKKPGKLAVKEKRFDDAWRFFHEQKTLYLQHASRSGFDILSTLVLDSSIHEDLANILRMESKYQAALINIAYVYKACRTAKRPLISLEKKLKIYFGRANDKNNYEKFKKLLDQFEYTDYISVKNLVQNSFTEVDK